MFQVINGINTAIMTITDNGIHALNNPPCHPKSDGKPSASAGRPRALDNWRCRAPSLKKDISGVYVSRLGGRECETHLHRLDIP